MKKPAPFMLALVLAVGLLTGCAGKDPKTGPVAGSNADGTTEASYVPIPDLTDPTLPSDPVVTFLKDRFCDGKTYVPFSYFKGATPANDYTPDEPFTLVVESNPYSDANEGYKKLFVRSGGADSPREIVLRRKGDGTWLLWEQFILVGIREPKSADPWA